MKNKALFTALYAIALIAALFIGGAVGFFLGRHDAGSTDGNGLGTPTSQTFYAEISEINGQNLLVEGIELNDINFRGAFSLSIDNNTRLEWRYTEIELSELSVGDRISVTFSGEVLESYPAMIRGITKITLLDDEK